MTMLEWFHISEDEWVSDDWNVYLCGDEWQLLWTKDFPSGAGVDHGTWPTAASARLAAQVWEDAQ